MMKNYLAPLALLALAACSSSTDAASGAYDAGHSQKTDASVTSGDDDGGTLAGDDASDPTDFQSVYSLYFASGTAGHCGDCHAGGRGGFTTGTVADTMYQGLIADGQIDVMHPTQSPIGVSSQSVLSWYNVPEQGKTSLDGRMPDDNAVENDTAAAAVTAWVAAGARNHGLLPSGSGSGDDDDDDSGVGADSGAGDDSGVADSGTDAATDGGKTDAGADTWTSLYANYFGPNTPGHCGNSYCHRDSGSSGGKDLVCGTTQAACYKGLVSSGLVSTTSPSTSSLGVPTTSPLSWYGHGGKMPDDNRMTNAAAAAAVTAWLNAGAKNN
jgi:hypothetical protein